MFSGLFQNYQHLLCKLSKELKNGIEILVGKQFLTYGSNSRNIVLINNLRTARPTLSSSLYLISLDIFLYDAYFFFKKCC